MRLDRTKNSIRNAVFGLLYRVISIVMPFMVRTVFIKILGVEFLGINSLFTSILTVLNLAELGFSSAIVFCMYKPIAENNTCEINALLLFYKRVYFYIGVIITTLGIIIIPFLPYIVKGGYPENINIIIVYLIFLFNTVVSYFLFAYLGSLITAFQREDIISKVNIVITTVMYLVQMVVLYTVKNYYIYILILPIFTIINNIRTALIAKKMFPQYTAIGKISSELKKEIKEKVTGLLIFKICYVSRNAFDSIFISMFLGLADTAIYNNYYYVMNAVVGITSVLTSSVLAGAGNSVVSDSVDKNYSDMNKMNFIYMWIAGWFTTCMLCVYQHFMMLWVGENLMYPISVVVLLCIYFYVLKMGDVRYIYEQAKGLWWEYRYRSIMETVSNIILNYFLGLFFGVYGIIIATICTIFFINYFYGARVIFKLYFKNQNILDYFMLNGVYAITTIIACFFTYQICANISYTWLGFILRLIIVLIVPNVIFFVLLHKTKIFRDSFIWIRTKFKILKKVDNNE